MERAATLTFLHQELHFSTLPLFPLRMYPEGSIFAIGSGQGKQTSTQPQQEQVVLETFQLQLWMGLQVLQIELVCNLGVIIDLQLLLQEQIVAEATRAFGHLHVVHQLWMFLDHDHGYSCLGHLPTGLLYMGVSLKSTQKLQLLPNAVG